MNLADSALTAVEFGQTEHGARAFRLLDLLQFLQIPLADRRRRHLPERWAVQRGRYMSLETIAPLSDDPIVKLPAVATA